MTRRYVALVLALAALFLGGCGGSAPEKAPPRSPGAFGPNDSTLRARVAGAPREAEADHDGIPDAPAAERSELAAKAPPPPPPPPPAGAAQPLGEKKPEGGKPQAADGSEAHETA